MGRLWVYVKGDCVTKRKIEKGDWSSQSSHVPQMCKLRISRTKKEGLISLDQENPKNPFMAKALRYLSDGHDENLIEDMLNKDIRLTVSRHTTGQGVFKGMGDSAPAFGMIGTLIGLVQMLSSMSDPASIGPAMAVALLTTLYGALLANFICLPLADKLALRSQQEQQSKAIIREAAVGINQALSPISNGMVVVDE